MTEHDLDAILQLLSTRHRRQAIHHLRHDATGTTIDDLADRLHAGGSASNGQPTDREQLVIQLYHSDLPTLADHGVVDFDPETRAVHYRPDDQIEAVLDSFPDEPSLAHP